MGTRSDTEIMIRESSMVPDGAEAGLLSFNLVDEPWIPVLVGGRREEVSVRQAFTDAELIVGITEDDALQTVAILRQVLLPVLLDAVGPPRSEQEWVARWNGEGAGDWSSIVQLVTCYLSEHKTRFDLFHPMCPFAQVAGLTAVSKQTKPVSLILPAIAVNNAVPLFSSWTDAVSPTISAAAAARALLATHCWDTAGIKTGAEGDASVKGGKSYGNWIGPLGQFNVVVPLGRTLRETLLLNSPILRQGLKGQDHPQWRYDKSLSPEWTTRPARGLLDLLTWQARRIRLVPEMDRGNALVVRHVVVTGGDRLDPLPIDTEPHSAWKEGRAEKGSQARVQPVRPQVGRAAWRGLEALVSTLQPSKKAWTTSLLAQLAFLRNDGYVQDDLPLQVLTVGVEYGAKSAVIDEVSVDRIPLPLRVFDETADTRAFVLEIVEEAENLRRAANDLSRDLRHAAGGDGLPWDKGQHLGDLLIYRLESSVLRVLVGLQRQPARVAEAREAWKTSARRAAREMALPALENAPPTAFLGRPRKGSGGRQMDRMSTAEARYLASLTRILGVRTNVSTSNSSSGEWT